MRQRPMLSVLAAAASALLWALPQAAVAQVQRAFPQNALRGTFVVVQPPEIELNGRPARLGPGARIHNASNMRELSAALVGSRYLVHYTLDTLDLVKEVWILTPEEAAKRPWPSTAEQAQAWRFDPVAQVWRRP